MMAGPLPEMDFEAAITAYLYLSKNFFVSRKRNMVVENLIRNVQGNEIQPHGFIGHYSKALCQYT